jgi:hypothetical protein
LHAFGSGRLAVGERDVKRLRIARLSRMYDMPAAVARCSVSKLDDYLLCRSRRGGCSLSERDIHVYKAGHIRSVTLSYEFFHFEATPTRVFAGQISPMRMLIIGRDKIA